MDTDEEGDEHGEGDEAVQETEQLVQSQFSAQELPPSTGARCTSAGLTAAECWKPPVGLPTVRTAFCQSTLGHSPDPHRHAAVRRCAL